MHVHIVISYEVTDTHGNVRNACYESKPEHAVRMSLSRSALSNVEEAYLIGH